ncbi:hypothetical protein KDW_05070 [Dictyobacter vulcani]|uniref:Uncharacterized protein n=1 Tax=Dictyobacter vulcani TaxID=2607529 RepID=A0A5J4KG10_9CHLR|nr:hypothetical protein KDW_05070 [Dictyobacter vulcani]
MDIFGVSPFITVPLAAVVVWFLVVRGNYKYVERILLVLCAIYLSYVGSGFLVHPGWVHVFHQPVVPPLQLNQGYLLTLVAVIGTTIAPWMQFYQQSSVADKQIPVQHLRYEQIDTLVGAFLTDFVIYPIWLTFGDALCFPNIQVFRRRECAPLMFPWKRRFSAILTHPSFGIQTR